MINNLFLRLPPGLRHQIHTWLQQSPSHAECEQYQLEHSENLFGRADHVLGPGKRHNVRRQALQSARRHWHLIVTAIGLFLLLVSVLLPGGHTSLRDSASSIFHKEAAQNLYVLIPTSNLNTELCRTIVTAKILHYPTPILVRWDGGDNDPREEAKRRLVAFRDHLNGLHESVSNHTVILLLEPDTWFQLRPEVLLQRFYETNKVADARLANKLGSGNVQKGKPRPRVTFSSSSTCDAHGKNETGCVAVPRSPVDGASHYAGLGSIVGSIEDVKAIFLRAVAKFEDPASKHKTELSVLSEIYGEQELQREILRQSHWSRTRKLWHSLFSPFGIDQTALDLLTTNEGWKPDDEFGIHLDYTSSLSLPSTSSSGAHFTTHAPNNLPQDILLSTPPLWTTSALFPATSWSSLPLFTHPKTSSIPALLHSPSSSLWPRLWLHAHARALLTASVHIPALPIASVMDNEGVEQHFWAPTPWHQDVGAKSSDGGWYPWNQMCEGEDVAKDVFGDGKGVWVEPAI